MTDTTAGEGDRVAEARRALQCLRLEVAPSIADDIERRVELAFTALAARPSPGAQDERETYLRGSLDVVLRAVLDMARVGIEVAKQDDGYHTEERDRARIDFIREVCERWKATPAQPDTTTEPRVEGEGYLSWLMRATVRGQDADQVAVTKGDLRGVLSLIPAPDQTDTLRKALEPFASIKINGEANSSEIVPNGYSSADPWRDDVIRAREALAAQPSAGAQVVARWECRTYGVDGMAGAWELSDGPADGKTLRPCRIIEYRPLYATPAHPDTGDVAALLALFGDDSELMVVERSAPSLEISTDSLRSEILAALSKPNAQGREG